MVGDGVINLAEKERNHPSATPSSPVLPELSKNLDSPERNIPKYRGPAILVAKEYIRCNWHMIKNNAWNQENSSGEKKSVAEDQTSPNPGNPCKRKRSERVKRVFRGEGFTEEDPTLTTSENGSETGSNGRSQMKQKTRSLKDIYASTTKIVVPGY